MRTLARTALAAIFVFLFLFAASNGGYAQKTSSAGAQATLSPGVPQVSGISSGPRIWLQENQPLPVQQVVVQLSNGQGVSFRDVSAMTSMSQSQPVSRTTCDLD